MIIEETKEGLISKIIKIVLQAANNSSDQWVYAGYIFSVRKGSTEMIDFFFDEKNQRGFLEDKDWFKLLRNNFKNLHKITLTEEKCCWVVF